MINELTNICGHLISAQNSNENKFKIKKTVAEYPTQSKNGVAWWAEFTNA